MSTVTLFLAATIPGLVTGGQEIAIACEAAKPSSLLQLTHGAFASHIEIKIPASKEDHDAELISVRTTMCFGAKIPRGKLLYKLKFAGRQNKDQKAAIAAALISGKLKLLEADPTKKVDVDPSTEEAIEAEVNRRLSERIEQIEDATTTISDDEPKPTADEQPPADDAPALE